ncbi:MAG: class D sortase [Acidimicrobiales bacterium]
MASDAVLGGHEASRRWRTSLLMALGALMLLAAALGAAYPLWWEHHSSSVGGSLVKSYGALPSGRGAARPAATCMASPRPSATKAAAGLVRIPALSLTAPVLNGLSDGVLAVAAGHDPASPWPGGLGESVLESHDVSYFSEIGKLTAGADVVWIDHCQELTFRVIGHEILNPGDLIYPPAGGRGLALITCYPTDALFYTPERFVLLTALVATKRATATPGPLPVVTPRVRVPAPPGLVAQGLQLANSGVLVGYLRLSGSPSAAWAEGPASLDLETLALESYIGAEKAIARHDTSWWRDLAVPDVAMPSAVWSNSLDTNVTEDIAGDSVRSVTLSSANVTFVLVASHGELLIKTITSPAFNTP